MNRRNVSFTSALIMLFLVTLLYEATVDVALGSPTTTICVDPTTSSAAIGHTFTIDINISDVVDLYGWEFKLGWNFTLLDAVDVTEGSFLNGGGARDTFFAKKINNTEGYILVDCTLKGAVPGVSGDGILATVRFYVEAEGECVLDLYDTTLVSSLEQPITHSATDGTFAAIDISIYDLNGDGVINIIDIVIVALAFDSQPGDPNWNPVADVNGDGVVNIIDVVAVALYFDESV